MSLARSLSVTVLRRVGNVLIALLVIAYITLFGLTMAERGRESLPAEPLKAAWEAVLHTGEYVLQHPRTYLWHRAEVSSLNLVLTTFGRSAGLLVVSLGLAAVIGVPLGIGAALARGRVGGPLVLLLSVVGVSTPSFLLAMLLWVVNIWVHRWLGVTVLPAAGFGWDGHLVMPAVVLAARPLAQVAQVTYVSLLEVLGQDYIRTARAKGLSWGEVRNRHALRNVLIPIMNALGTSLRFSLGSLPVVELFFHWPGVGLTIWEAIEVGEMGLVTDLTVSLGLMFLLIHLLLEFLYPVLDPRLRGVVGEEGGRERRSWGERVRGWVEAGAEVWADVRGMVATGRLGGERVELAALPVVGGEKKGSAEVGLLSRTGVVLRAVVGNPALLVGAGLVVGLVVLALWGSRMTGANAYELHGVMIVEGKIGAPPYGPSSVFRWGTDHLGRDIQALVLAGAKQTVTLAFFGMVARVLVGTVLGVVGGWWRGSWVDRVVTGAVGVWAAFPATIFAMLLIQALGIKQGMWVFVVAMAVVGWGEVAQYVRGQVIGVKPELYIEAARSMGSGSGQIVVRHVLPHLVGPLLVVAALEMGGILMLLAELGFLNVFLGGGFKVEIAADAGGTYFSDVPEWGSLLANIRAWWRSYPWMAWYPGMAFFLSIVAFNLFGEGLRRFLYEARVNLSRLVNRYTLLAASAVTVVLMLVLRGIAPLGVYWPQANRFDAQRAMEDIRVLSSPEYEGRETGTPGAGRAAEYIAGRMREIGLQPAGRDDTFIYAMASPRLHLEETPTLEILDERGEVTEELVYRRDFVEYAVSSHALGGTSFSFTYGDREGKVVGLTTGADPGGPEEDRYNLGGFDLYDNVLVVRESEAGRVNLGVAAGVLVATSDPGVLERRYLYYGESYLESRLTPVMYITEDAADRLLATAGSSLAELERMGAELGPGEVALTSEGSRVHLATSPTEDMADQYYHIIGFIPGTGSHMGASKGRGLDNQVIIVSAYYDGLGVGPDGTLYPGANDNASGVAAMLEMARVLKEGPFQPKKTVVFAAWAGGERGEGLSVTNVMGAKLGFSSLAVEAVIELSGVGAGRGDAIAFLEGSSFRLVQLFQAAANRMGAGTTTRGRGPHFGIESRAGFGGRSALSIYISWDGSDALAHTPRDAFQAIDRSKLERVGKTMLLALTVLSREVNY